MAIMLPGAAHAFSGHWKTGIVWYFACSLALLLCSSVLYSPYPLSSTTIIIFVQSLVIIYFVSLFLSSYRPTRQLGYSGWAVFLLFAFAINFSIETVNEMLWNRIGTHNAFIIRATGFSMDPIVTSVQIYCPDIVVVNTSSYKLNNPRRGDIAVFFVEKNGSFLVEKRVVGLPNETIEIQYPYVLINGEKLLVPPIFAKISSGKDGYVGYVDAKDMGYLEHQRVALPITLSSDEYFLLGDNSPNSIDSRHLGPVPRDAIVGKVTRIIFPPWRIREL